MWKLPRPEWEVDATFLACINRIRNADLKRRLDSILPSVIAASEEFEVAAETVELHEIASSDNVNGQVTVAEMADLYDLRMARKNSPGRPIYDELLSAPTQGRCPLCGHRNVSTLDHHLPKSLFPALAVTPINLVPVCADCNKLKLDTVPQGSDEETIHPYFDDIEADLWLHADVLQTAPAAILFSVSPPVTWSDLLVARVRRQFHMLRLAQLYGSQAAVEISNVRNYLGGLHAKSGTDGVREHLEEMARSCRANRVNSWQTATYSALSASDWFCEGGFAA